ncbi:MAG: hypothetical protein ACRECV_11030 [Xanthobacteraceae bacterium]
MAKNSQRKSFNRAGKKIGGPVRRAAPATEFCAAVRDALKRTDPEAVSDRTLQQVLTAAVKLYAAKVERRGHDVTPFTPNAVTATESVIAACGMIRAADLNMFDVAIWFHRPPGIE